MQGSSDSGLEAAGGVAHDRYEAAVALARPMLRRAISAFIVLPGMVAFAIPIAIGASAGKPVQHSLAAAILVCAGTVLLLWCVREFYVAGRGTLAPWSPPRRLVVSGPYRFTRNPMYVSVITIVLGWSVLWDSRVLIYYALGTLATVYARVRLLEEPWAARTFGSQWEAYRGRVPRWFV
ncbi:MAG TPA: isoprenylcysteine carboxylmethyltransferase family protein [Candidatus Dormibacteraeota bacterium]|nr:isoprenylcysteine carboxylmethyltransferase family protein [Candidatus Dormibacteraeota bacterium]